MSAGSAVYNTIISFVISKGINLNSVCIMKSLALLKRDIMILAVLLFLNRY